MMSSDTKKNPLDSLHIRYLKFLGADRNWTSSVYIKFLGGSVLGGFLVFLPLLYSEIGSWSQLTNLQIGLAMLVVLTCGSLTAKLGERFFDSVMKGFGNSGF
ncbi:MAG: hypothetical protein F6K11_04075 [Leptolyngbya sp. SIO3F4]|nr:hypothetical protein [Leptolyngbya sp. SIO3F4]